MIEKINFVIMCLFFICYAYQFAYIPAVWLLKRKEHKKAVLHRIAVLIAARNEEAVIGKLIDSISEQDYPKELLDVFVVADNCTDDTAAVAAGHGARVFVRNDSSQIGKGYALRFLLGKIDEHRTVHYDAFLVVDADNLLTPTFVTAINRCFSDGYEIVTCYRNSKNYGDNWISAGYALWFLREAKYLNQARMLLGSSCAVSGTGFLFSNKILNSGNGWNYFLLTEDIEFTISNVLRGVKIGYAADAELYDEQPVSFRQSWRQRLRWSRGYLQVFGRFGKELFAGMFKGSFSCYDMAMNIMPAAVLSALSVVVNVGGAIARLTGGGSWSALGVSVCQTMLNLFLTIFIIGAITTITEWKKIHCSTFKKLLYTVTFPLFMFTYIPICVASLFKNPSWKPIEHKRSISLEQIYSIDSEKAVHG